MKTRTWIAIWAWLALSAGAAQAWADETIDPPNRVGRLSLVQGEVSVRAYDSNTVTPALRNWPVTAHQLITTAVNGAAEVRIGSTALRIGADSALEVAELDDGQLALFLYYGSAGVSIRSLDMARDFVLRTPQGRITLQDPAVFRIDTQRQGDTTEVKAWQGTLNFDGSGASVLVKAGKQLRIGDDNMQTTTAIADNFDNWNADLDRAMPNDSVITRYVSADLTGYEELNRYGDWQMTSDYGPIWSPRNVGADWAPYRDGSWAWIAPWGWTWIDQAPWGYAPTHYGRWVWYKRHWSWTPGLRTVRPVWAPALVTWVDRHGARNDIIAVPGQHLTPNLGWFPLGPRDVYRPPYRVSNDRLRDFNIGHIPHFNERDPLPAPRYEHRDGRNAVTTLPPLQGFIRDQHGYATPTSRPPVIATPATRPRPQMGPPRPPLSVPSAPAPAVAAPAPAATPGAMMPGSRTSPTREMPRRDGDRDHDRDRGPGRTDAVAPAAVAQPVAAAPTRMPPPMTAAQPAQFTGPQRPTPTVSATPAPAPAVVPAAVSAPPAAAPDHRRERPRNEGLVQERIETPRGEHRPAPEAAAARPVVTVPATAAPAPARPVVVAPAPAPAARPPAPAPAAAAPAASAPARPVNPKNGDRTPD